MKLVIFTFLRARNMEASVCIEQKGTVEEVADQMIRVRIRRDTACGQCHARSMCNIGNNTETIIESTDYTADLKAGDHVNVGMTRTMGNKAIVLAYLVPFLLVITILLLMQANDSPEWLTGLGAVAVLVPYFLLLYVFRNKLRKTISFTVRKTEP
jgi:positive regulator of sigma E activity